MGNFGVKKLPKGNEKPIKATVKNNKNYFEACYEIR